MKLIMGSKHLSSWSLRGWLACKQSGLPFEEVVVPLLDAGWAQRRTADDLAPSAGMVPVLWDGEIVVWDSLAILEYLGDKVGSDRFWPRAQDARGLARAIVAEMHSSFRALRSQCPMNLHRLGQPLALDAETQGDVLRILTLWAEARARFGSGGPFLFGSFCAADIAFAPVVTRFRSYGVTVPGFAQAYIDAVWEHEWMQAWATAAAAET
ncbi:MAG: glutathione S-transferase family protein [Pseudomonadota bacterium]|nr:glutathione S-transferase family protein [Pseudomonadota bacterium]